jgi:hypothetical protein
MQLPKKHLLLRRLRLLLQLMLRLRKHLLQQQRLLRLLHLLLDLLHFHSQQQLLLLRLMQLQRKLLLLRQLML